MTEVTIFEDSSGTIVGIDAEGHSGQGSKGNDVLCASISTIFDFLNKGIEGLPSESVTIKRNPEEPKWSIKINRPAMESLHWQSLYRFLRSARSLLEDLSQQFPEHCQLTVTQMDP